MKLSAKHLTSDEVRKVYRYLFCCPLTGAMGFPLILILIWGMYGELAWSSDSARYWLLLVSTSAAIVTSTAISVIIIISMAMAYRKVNYQQSKRAFYVSIFGVIAELFMYCLFVTTMAILGQDFRDYTICALITFICIVKTIFTCGSLGVIRKYMKLIQTRTKTKAEVKKRTSAPKIFRISDDTLFSQQKAADQNAPTQHSTLIAHPGQAPHGPGTPHKDHHTPPHTPTGSQRSDIGMQLTGRYSLSNNTSASQIQVRATPKQSSHKNLRDLTSDETQEEV